MARKPRAKPRRANGANSIEPDLVRTIEAFLIREARLLDERRFEEWLALFAADGIYWVPAYPGQLSPIDTVSIYYENREVLDVRIRRLRHPRAFGQIPPSRTQHIVGNVTVEEIDNEKGEFLARSGFLMLEYRDEAQRLFGGEVRHRLRRAHGGFEIVQKRVDLINADATHEFFSIPF